MTVHTVSRWSCLGPATVPPQPCGEHGAGPGSDKAAEKHTKTTGHATCSFTTPKEGR